MSVDQQTVVRALIRDRSKLYAYILSIVRDEHLAEDVFQDVSVLVVDRREEIMDPAALPAWMRKAARFKALQAMERRRALPALLDASMLDLIESDWAHFDDLSSQDVADALRSCLAELTENSRTIIQLRYSDGLKSGQVAERLGRTAHSVYVALCRIHKQLATCVEARLAGEEDHRG